MKTKLSRFAVPYVVWMAIFVVAPIVIMVIYAFSNGEGGATLDNFVQMGGYAAVFGRSFKLALIATAICLLIGYPRAGSYTPCPAPPPIPHTPSGRPWCSSCCPCG